MKTKRVKNKIKKKASKKPKKTGKKKINKPKRTIKKHSYETKRKNPKIATGIPSYDKMIEGGFQDQSINLIVGGIGSGKTIFALQFLMEGIKRNEKVLYITFEEKKEDFYKNMKQLGWDLQKEENNGKFIFLEYSPEKVKMMLDEGGGAIEAIVLKNNIKRMVIDSITSFSLLFDDDLSRRQATLGLFDIIRKWDCTILLTVQNSPTDAKTKGIPTIEFEADSITLLYFVNINNKRKRFIEVLKMRGTNHSTEVHNFEIKKGIKVGRKAKIKPGY
jgi:circadian clock protein KaiC